MSLSCANGWRLDSAPSTPATLERNLPDLSPWFTSVTFTNRKLRGIYEWEQAKGVLPVQGSCDRRFNFTGAFTVEESSQHSINMGVLFNAPFIGEAAEISGGYAYTWGSSTGTGSGLEQEVGGEQCWEFMAVPVVLKFTICLSWNQSGVPWFDYLNLLMNAKNYRHQAKVIVGYGGYGSMCEAPLYLRGGIMVCKRWCCEGTPPPG